MSLAHHRGGSGEPLVLVHGIGASWRSWRPVLDALEARHEVIAIDLPGFGDSPPDGTGATVEEQAERVEAFFMEAGLTRPHVSGFSMGGGIALELARRGVVASASAIAPVGFWTPREMEWCRRTLSAGRAFAAANHPVVDRLCASPVGRALVLGQAIAKPARVSPDEARELVATLVAAREFESRAEAFARYTFHDAQELRDVPVTVIWGDRDYVNLSRQFPRAQRVLPWADHIALPGCGHVPFHDDTQAVASAVLAATA